ncbi:response regulator [Paenibacillus chitinolyticus]|uniref:response regulator n=1 Tax=Paenibacillus chitinolyticus TaxID=79263 RepID=UPI003868C8FA
MNKLLIVDDESQIVDILSYACKREGFAVETAFSGLEALRKIEEWGPQILILDLMLPDMNGFEVCRKIRNPDSLGIIMLTAEELRCAGNETTSTGKNRSKADPAGKAAERIHRGHFTRIQNPAHGYPGLP